MTREVILERIGREADELAVQYNKTKDPGLRDQWFKLVSSLRNLKPVDTETSDKVLRSPPGLRKKHLRQIK